MISDELRELVDQGIARGPANAVAKYSEAWRSPNRWTNRERRHVRMVVWHITDGAFDPSIGWLCNPESEASANDVIDRDGTVYNIVSGAEAPWTNGRLAQPDVTQPLVAQAVQRGVNPNWWSYTIENVGKTTRGRVGALTLLQAAALILRTAQACELFHLSADREHVLPHSAFDSVDRAGCPGFAVVEWVDWTDEVRRCTREWRGW